MDPTETTPSPLAWHPLRRTVLDEVHARPFQLIKGARRFQLQAFATTPEEGAKGRDALDTWAAMTSAPRPEAGAKFHVAALATADLRFESHTEFTTWTWSAPAKPETPFHWPPLEPSPVGGALIPPGLLMVGIDLAIVPDVPVRALDFQKLFDPTSLCVSEVMGGAAMIATDFRQDARGNTRILVIDKGLGPARAGALVQRLMEIETYRTFALLGLPEAIRVSPLVAKVERELVEVTRLMDNTAGLEGNSQLLERMVKLAAELETEATRSAYRFGATRAYDAIVKSRLEVIGEKAVTGFPTLASFLDRRMAPAIRTCQSVADRQAELSRKLTRAANLLRTRVDVEMQSQNRAQLESMNERATMQLRLQQTVEGLSVAAVSYYVIGLLNYLFKWAYERGFLPVDTTTATAIAVPVVVVVFIVALQRMKRRWGHR